MKLNNDIRFCIKHCYEFRGIPREEFNAWLHEWLIDLLIEDYDGLTVGTMYAGTVYLDVPLSQFNARGGISVLEEQMIVEDSKYMSSVKYNSCGFDSPNEHFSLQSWKETTMGPIQ